MNKWNSWYHDLTENTPPSAFCYGDTYTYSKGYEWLKPCSTVEDWGCGVGGFKRFFTTDVSRYTGVDGSVTPFADKQVDLTTYVSDVDGIFIRHVIEHNYAWSQILDNACKSFRRRMCLVLFTPLAEHTIELAHNAKYGVDAPDLSLSRDELTAIFTANRCTYTVETMNTPTGYSVETIFYVEKSHCT